MGEAFDGIRKGLEQAHAHARGQTPKGMRVYTPESVNVAQLRERLGLTQEQFAARFGFSVATLRHWERGDRRPTGASLVLLNVIERNPKAVLAALS